MTTHLWLTHPILTNVFIDKNYVKWFMLQKHIYCGIVYNKMNGNNLNFQ